MTFTEMLVKWSVTLADRLGREILTVLQNKGTSFASPCTFTFEGSCGWLSDLNALLTRKLLKFLSRLNETSGGTENMFSLVT